MVQVVCQQNYPPQNRSPVGSFWWKEIISLFGKFQTIADCKPNMGDTITFWAQTWEGQDKALRDKYPQLFSFTRKPKCSLLFFIEQDVDRIFCLPLSQIAANQLTELENYMDNFNFIENEPDTWSYCWGGLESIAVRKPMLSYKGTVKHLLFSLGFGVHVTLVSKNSSSGSSSGTD